MSGRIRFPSGPPAVVISAGAGALAAAETGAAMTDYWLNKLMFDLQGPGGKERWTGDREAVMDLYPLAPEVRKALLEDDFSVIQPRANPYLLRFFLLICGYGDAESIAILSALAESGEAAHG